MIMSVIALIVLNQKILMIKVAPHISTQCTMAQLQNNNYTSNFTLYFQRGPGFYSTGNLTLFVITEYNHVSASN